MLVERLTRAAGDRARQAGATICQATSGAMTAIFPGKIELEQFACEWPLEVALRAPGLQLVQAWVPKEVGLKALFSRLAERRNQAFFPEVEANPWVLRAGRSGLPAIETPPSIRSQARLTRLDAQALAKERSRQMERSEISAVTGGYPWSSFEEETERWGEGPVAVIHADGSGVGKKLLEIGDDPGRLTRFSEALSTATAAAIKAAVDGLPEKQPRKARPIVSAGDDMTYIVPAAQARRFSEIWLQHFYQETEKRESELGGPLGAGAGIVVVHRRYPFSRAYELAENLCRRAKKAAGPQRCVLAFERVTTSMASGDCPGSVAWLVDSHQGVSELLKLTAASRDIPRGTLRNWLSLFEQNRQEQAAQLWERAREVAEASRWQSFETALESVTGRYLPLSDKPTTPLRDALVLRQFEKEVV